MKLTKQQQKVANCISNVVSMFVNPDISDSKTWSNIEAFVHADLDDVLDDKKFIEYIIEKLKMLYHMIKDIK